LFTCHSQTASRSSDEASSDYDLGRFNNLIDAINEEDASRAGSIILGASGREKQDKGLLN